MTSEAWTRSFDEFDKNEWVQAHVEGWNSPCPLEAMEVKLPASHPTPWIEDRNSWLRKRFKK